MWAKVRNSFLNQDFWWTFSRRQKNREEESILWPFAHFKFYYSWKTLELKFRERGNFGKILIVDLTAAPSCLLDTCKLLCAAMSLLSPPPSINRSCNANEWLAECTIIIIMIFRSVYTLWTWAPHPDMPLVSVSINDHIIIIIVSYTY